MHSAFVFLLLTTAVIAVPQFGSLGGVPKVPAALGKAPAPVPLSNPTELLEWPAKIQDLVELTRTTLTTMGAIATEDNPEVGAQIVATLQGEILRATKIFTDFTANVAGGGGKVLRKREVSDGDKAYNEVGDVLVGSNKKIDSDKKKLSPKAQKKIDKEHRAAIKKCGADSCKTAAAAITAVENAQDEEE